MSSEHRARVFVDWIADVPRRIAQALLPLKERARKNPGFLAAAGAGALGLVLALGLLINTGLNWLNQPADDSNAQVTAGELDADLGAEGDLVDSASPYAESFAAMRADAEREKNSREEEDDPILGPRAAADSAETSRRRHVLDDDESPDIDDRSQQDASDEHPLARRFTRNDDFERVDDDVIGDHPLAERAPRRARIELPADLDEDGFDDLKVEEPDADQELSSDPAERRKSWNRPPVSHPLAGEEEEEENVGDSLGSQASTRPERAAIVIDDLAEDEPTAKPEEASARGWKRQPPHDTETAAPVLSTRRSRPVETVIYAAPEPDSARPTKPAASENPAGREQGAVSNGQAPRPQLRIEVVGPRSVITGQPCDLEIRVLNLGGEPAQKLALEVELPAGLKHEVARNLTQEIGELPAGATHRALLKLKARSPGKAVLQIDVEWEGKIVASSSASIVGYGTGDDARANPTKIERVVLPECCCPPLAWYPY
jgi:hypothetical protein